jgi:hypothetical protein
VFCLAFWLVLCIVLYLNKTIQSKSKDETNHKTKQDKTNLGIHTVLFQQVKRHFSADDIGESKSSLGKTPDKTRQDNM